MSIRNTHCLSKVSPKTYAILNTIYGDMFRPYTPSIVETQVRNFERNLTPSDWTRIRENANYSHIPDQIKAYYDRTAPIGKVWTPVIAGRSNITVYFVGNTTKTDMRNIWIWLNYIIPRAKSECANKSLNIYLLFSPFKKQLPPNSGQPIAVENANTAYTWACLPHAEIFLFRREEWFKVLIHETFHCFGMDFALSTQTETTNNALAAMFPACDPKTDFRLYETYCEIWANIIRILYLARFSATGKTSHGKTTIKNRMDTPIMKKQTRSATSHELVLNKTIFARLLKREQEFSIHQSEKVLRHNGIQTYEQLFVHNGGPKYTEKTPTFSYYVLKSIFLCNLNEFIEWCERNNTKHIMVFELANEPKYIDLLRGLYRMDIPNVNGRNYDKPQNNLRMTYPDKDI